MLIIEKQNRNSKTLRRKRATFPLPSPESPSLPGSLHFRYLSSSTTAAGHTQFLQWGNNWCRSWGQVVVVSLCCPLFVHSFPVLLQPTAAVPPGLYLLSTMQHVRLHWPCYSLIPSVVSSSLPPSSLTLLKYVLTEVPPASLMWSLVPSCGGPLQSWLKPAVSGPWNLLALQPPLLPKPYHLYAIQQLNIFIISSTCSLWLLLSLSLPYSLFLGSSEESVTIESKPGHSCLVQYK